MIRPVENTPQAQAAEWMVMQREGELTGEDARAFGAWLEAGPENRAVYAELQALWDEAGEIADDPTILALRDLNFRTFDRPGWLRWASGAVAASILAAAVGSWAYLDAGGTLDAAPRLAQKAAPSAEQVLRTGVGQTSTAILKDGSTVVLDSNTLVRAIETGDRRTIWLERGGAFFQVAKDPTRPFVVVAAGKTITALGTAFEARVTGDKLDVTLIEGKVKVEEKKRLIWQGEQEMDLSAGWRLSAPEDQQWALQRVDATRELSWMSGRLTFFNDTLVDAVAKVNRYSDRKIIVDPRLDHASIVGVFESGDTDKFVRGMELAGIAQVGRVTETTIELLPLDQASEK